MSDLVQSEKTWFVKESGSFILKCGSCGKEFDLLNLTSNLPLREHAKEHGSSIIGMRENL